MWEKATFCLLLTAISGLMLRSSQSSSPIPILSSNSPAFAPLSQPLATLEVDSDDSDDWVNAEIEAEGRETVQFYRLRDRDRDEVLNVSLVSTAS